MVLKEDTHCYYHSSRKGLSDVQLLLCLAKHNCVQTVLVNK